MACPKCGCKVSYQYDPGDDLEQTDERLERCAACRHVFDIEDSADEEDEDAHGALVGVGTGQALPPVPESAYPPDAKPLRITFCSGHSDFLKPGNTDRRFWGATNSAAMPRNPSNDLIIPTLRGLHSATTRQDGRYAV